jgi:hypothetical protein
MARDARVRNRAVAALYLAWCAAFSRSRAASRSPSSRSCSPSPS